MKVFETTGPENTTAAAVIAVERAKELGCPIVLSSKTGASAEAVLEEAARAGFTGPVVVVRSAGFAGRNGVPLMPPEMMESLKDRGCTIVGAAHALSAGERGLSGKFQGVYPLEIVAATLRMLGAGVKVCVECAIMAVDASAIPYNEPVVALGGTKTGLDTAVVITPGLSSSLLDTRVHEILCKPHL